MDTTSHSKNVILNSEYRIKKSNINLWNRPADQTRQDCLIASRFPFNDTVWIDHFLPVSSSDGKRFYRNKACARCNREKASAYQKIFFLGWLIVAQSVVFKKLFCYMLKCTWIKVFFFSNENKYCSHKKLMFLNICQKKYCVNITLKTVLNETLLVCKL